MMWKLTLVCCSYLDGIERFATREEAEAFRETYTSGPRVNPHGYSGTGAGHKRAAILQKEAA